MLIAMFVVTLLAIAVALVTLISVGNLAIRLDGITEQIAAADDDNKLQHRIDRGYIGNALLEQKVLPLLGYKKPERSAFDRQLLAEVANDPDFQ
jgi:hypothetical protein